MKSVVIQASARSNGNTAKLAQQVATLQQATIVDLNQYSIDHFNYENTYTDDFQNLITEIIHTYDTIYLATPVYWYSVSGHLKVFLDRLSDLLLFHKELGKQLRTKQIALLSNSSESELNYDFALPIRMTANYLGMNYIGHLHVNNTNLSNIEWTLNTLNNKSKHTII